MALPPGVDFTPLNQLSTTPAKQYPFQLDAFQREAILVSCGGGGGASYTRRVRKGGGGRGGVRAKWRLAVFKLVFER